MAEKPYRVIVEGEDGRGTQVWEAETPEEMQGQFKQAQTHATQKIREQAQEIAQLRQFALQAQAGNGHHEPEVNRDQRVQELLSDPDAAIERVICKKLGVNSLQEVVQDYAGVRQGATRSNMEAAANQFVNSHPEWNSLSDADKKREGMILGQIVEEQGWPVDNPEVLDLAYKVGLGSGRFKILHGTVDEPPNYRNGPIPTTVTRPSAQINTSESEAEFLTHAPLKDVEKYIRKKHGG